VSIITSFAVLILSQMSCLYLVFPLIALNIEAILGPPEGTVGWRVAHRTLGQGFKPLRCQSVPPWLGVGAPHVQSGYTLV
jgi:hypothetical protein